MPKGKGKPGKGIPKGTKGGKDSKGSMLPASMVKGGKKGY